MGTHGNGSSNCVRRGLNGAGVRSIPGLGLQGQISSNQNRIARGNDLRILRRITSVESVVNYSVRRAAGYLDINGRGRKISRGREDGICDVGERVSQKRQPNQAQQQAKTV